MHYFKKNRKLLKILIVFFTSVIVIGFPVYAHAGFFSSLLYPIPLGLLTIAILLSKGFAWMSGGLLDWVVSGNLITWGYTNNPLVKAGLSITKQFVNLGLVTILIVISIGITLRLKDYDAKKMLFRIIAVALLVNFAPVFIGLIVDATNIVMNYFLAGVTDGISGILNNFTGTSDSIAQAVEDIENIQAGFAVLIRGATYVVLNISIGLAFLVLFFIFILRYIAIWLLTILSPLAFVAWIIPSTKGYWDEWKKQLIQWSIIGIPMAFFLYLSMASYKVIGIALRSSVTLPGLDTGTSGLINQTFPYIIVLIMLYMGFLWGLKTSAMGAGAIISATTIGGQDRVKRLWKYTKEEAGRGFRRRVGTADKAEQIGRWAARTPILRSYVGKPLLSYARKRREEEKASLKDFPLETQARLRGQTIQQAIKGLDPKKFTEEIRPKELNLETFYAMSSAQIKKLGTDGSAEQKEALQKTIENNQGNIMERVNQLRTQGQKEGADQLMNKFEESLKGTSSEASLSVRAILRGQTSQEFIKDMKPENFVKEIRPDELNLETFYSMSSAQIKKLGADGNTKQKEALRETMENNYQAILDRYEDLINQGLEQEALKIEDKVSQIDQDYRL